MHYVIWLIRRPAITSDEYIRRVYPRLRVHIRSSAVAKTVKDKSL
ncbi:MAG: hypothetical protein ABIP85_24345 [Chthoniobacteraceae bacterium]